ncbi:hypothetical protein KAH55_01370 [bacterium]|nr:hypothetical protein [bacterium]
MTNHYASPQRAPLLMTKAVDGQLTPEEQTEFRELLKTNPEYRKEWREQRQLKEVLQQMIFKSPDDIIWEEYWFNIYNRLERKIGWLFLSLGSIILLTFGLYQFILEILNETTLPPIIKGGIFALIAGAAILLISVIREKLTRRKHDPYKEVQL